MFVKKPPYLTSKRKQNGCSYKFLSDIITDKDALQLLFDKHTKTVYTTLKLRMTYVHKFEQSFFEREGNK